MRDALALDGGEHLARVEVVEQHDAAAGVDDVVRQHAGGVREGGAGELPGQLPLRGPRLIHHPTHPVDLLEGGDDALGVARRTAGVPDGADVVGAGAGHERLVALHGGERQQVLPDLTLVLTEYENVSHGRALGDLHGAVRVVRVDDQYLGLDVLNDRRLHIGRQLVVEVVDPAAHEIGGVTGRDRLGQIAAEQGDGRLARDALSGDRVSHAVHQRVELTGRQAPVLVHQDLAVRVGRQCVEVVLDEGAERFRRVGRGVRYGRVVHGRVVRSALGRLGCCGGGGGCGCLCRHGLSSWGHRPALLRTRRWSCCVGCGGGGPEPSAQDAAPGTSGTRPGMVAPDNQHPG